MAHIDAFVSAKAEYQTNKNRLYKGRNIFNVEPNAKFDASSEAKNTFVSFAGHQPPLKIPPAKGSIQLGGDEKYYLTETAQNFAEKGYVKREMMRPPRLGDRIFNSSPSDPLNSMANARSMVQSDFQAPSLAEIVPPAKIWGNRSDDVHRGGPERFYTSETAAQFNGAAGRPAATFKPKNSSLIKESHPFEGASVSQTDFKAYEGKREKYGKPRAAMSVMMEQKLIHHVGEGGHYISENASNFNHKVGKVPQRILPRNEGLGFAEVGAPEDRDFKSEVRESFVKKPYEPVQKNKALDPNNRKYERTADDREWKSESTASHNHCGFQVSERAPENYQTSLPPRAVNSARGRTPSNAHMNQTQSMNQTQRVAATPSQTAAAPFEASAAKLPQDDLPVRPESSHKVAYVPALKEDKSDKKRKSEFAKPKALHNQPSVGNGVGGIQALKRN